MAQKPPTCSCHRQQVFWAIVQSVGLKKNKAVNRCTGRRVINSHHTAHQIKQKHRVVLEITRQRQVANFPTSIVGLIQQQHYSHVMIPHGKLVFVNNQALDKISPHLQRALIYSKCFGTLFLCFGIVGIKAGIIGNGFVDSASKLKWIHGEMSLGKRKKEIENSNIACARARASRNFIVVCSYSPGNVPSPGLSKRKER